MTGIAQPATKGRVKHGDARGPRRAPEYVSWRNMLKRCLNPKDDAYDNYGGRGITVCERWRSSYEAFLKDVGRRPDPRPYRYTLDRKEVNGNYEPGNVRWATPAEQNENKRTVSADWSKHGGAWLFV